MSETWGEDGDMTKLLKLLPASMTCYSFFKHSYIDFVLALFDDALHTCLLMIILASKDAENTQCLTKEDHITFSTVCLRSFVRIFKNTVNMAIY